MNRAAFPYLVLASGVVITSTAAVFIRLAQEAGMPSLAIAAGRLLVASAILLPLAGARAGNELRHLSRRDVFWGVLAGFFLAVHIAAWISSLAYTSVASSTALLSTSPLWTAALAFVLFGERLRRVGLAGVLLTIGGSILIGLSDLSAETLTRHPNATLGNLLALLGGLTVAGYVLAGRGLQRRLSTLAYITLAYSSGAVGLLLLLPLSGTTLLGYPSVAYLLVLALALGPQMLGHTALNWSLRSLSATFVTVAVLGEPIIAAALAWPLFGETFAPLQLAGFVLLLGGIYLVSLHEKSREN